MRLQLGPKQVHLINNDIHLWCGQIILILFIHLLTPLFIHLFFSFYILISNVEQQLYSKTSSTIVQADKGLIVNITVNMLNNKYLLITYYASVPVLSARTQQIKADASSHSGAASLVL